MHRQPAVSVAALTRDLKRDYKRVHADVQALAGNALLDRADSEVRAAYDEIRAVIVL